MIRLRSLQPIIMLLSVFLLVPVQAMGTVLCIGADGHIAFEVANKAAVAISRPRHLLSTSANDPKTPSTVAAVSMFRSRQVIVTISRCSLRQLRHRSLTHPCWLWWPVLFRPMPSLLNDTSSYRLPSVRTLL